MKAEIEVIRFNSTELIVTSGCANPGQCTCFNPNPAAVADV